MKRREDHVPSRTPTARRYSALGHLLLEFIVIVAGVLAALAVDQWRQSREDRVFERELLQNLALEIVADSADFARLPIRAHGRVNGAEVLLRNFRPNDPRTVRASAALDTLGPFPEPASDEEIVRAFAALVVSSDMDVALGAYREFSEGGGQRLVRNRELRRLIHRYYTLVFGNLKYDPWVAAALSSVRERANELGLAGGDNNAALIRERLSSADADVFFAAVRTLQDNSLNQNSIAANMLTRVRTVLDALRAELAE